MTRSWIDSATGIATAKARIAGARVKRHGLIIGGHPSRFGPEKNATVQDLVDFLDWLVAEQDAGRVRVLTLEEWSIAQYGISP